VRSEYRRATLLELIRTSDCLRMVRNLARVPPYPVTVAARIEPSRTDVDQPSFRITRESRIVSLGRRRIGISRKSKTSLVETRSTPSCPIRPFSLRSASSHGSFSAQLRAASAPAASSSENDMREHSGSRGGCCCARRSCTLLEHLYPGAVREPRLIFFSTHGWYHPFAWLEHRSGSECLGIRRSCEKVDQRRRLVEVLAT
jgi:hypothetical protein